MLPTILKEHVALYHICTTLDTHAHMVPGAQENAASVMDEITTPITLPPDLIAPRDFIAPDLHHESDAGKNQPK